MLPPGTNRTLDATRMSDSVSRLISQRAHTSGRVHSVFRAALNIVTVDGLVTIAAEDAGGLPNGILLPGAIDYRAHGLQQDMIASLDRAAVRVPAAGFVIRISSARPWSARLPVADGRRWATRTADAHALLRSAVRLAPAGLLAIPVARELLADVGRAIARGDDEGAALAARSLVGMGPGLTPSGDDALVGVEAALHALGHPSAGFLAAALADVDERTTAVSAVLLSHASRGEFTERIHRLLGALLVGRAQALPAAVRRAVAWGATSGADGVSGVLTGLDAATSGQRCAA